jgi:class 3 adenylate cyclase
MKVKPSLVSLAVRALAESMGVHIMEKTARVLIPGYNLHKRTGFPESIPIPNIDASKQIVKDMNNLEIFPHFINLLIKIQFEGYMGRKYPIAHLREIIEELTEYGFIYDKINKIFVEDPKIVRTRNWGTLRNDTEYIFAFLRLDIVRNSELVRKYSTELISKTYADLKDIVDIAIERRNGRVWIWEGDGGLVAFYFSYKNILATISAMEIIHELFIYNQLFCQLDEPLAVRIAVHRGPCEYTEYEDDLMNSDTIKQAIEIEQRYAKPDSVTISKIVYEALVSTLADRFKAVKTEGSVNYYNYQLKWK